jgi:hypothetical protein
MAAATTSRGAAEHVRDQGWREKGVLKLVESSERRRVYQQRSCGGQRILVLFTPVALRLFGPMECL